jgi:hypothetical protein
MSWAAPARGPTTSACEDGCYCNRNSSLVLDASSKDAARVPASNLGWRTEQEHCQVSQPRKRKAS